MYYIGTGTIILGAIACMFMGALHVDKTSFVIPIVVICVGFILQLVDLIGSRMEFEHEHRMNRILLNSWLKMNKRTKKEKKNG